jgi:hypothetical protein
MALKVYNPKTKAFAVLATSGESDLPLSDVLLLNILIEMQVHTEYLAALTPGNPVESPEALRSSLVSKI